MKLAERTPLSAAPCTFAGDMAMVASWGCSQICSQGDA